MALSGPSWPRDLRLAFLLSSSLFFIPVDSRLVNITVDDTFGDLATGSLPEYSPNNGTWNAGSSTENCPSCYIGPSILDLAQIHNKTWHDTTYLPWETPATIKVHFNGSAVYVFNILPNTLPQTITLANISFSIDGQDVGSFIRSPDPGTTILYNQLVYSNTTLNDGPHTLTMTAGGNSLVLFDYLLYTTQGNDTTSTSTTSTSSSHSTLIGAVVGGVIGGVVLLSGVVIGAFLFYKKRMRYGNNHNDGSIGGSERRQYLVRAGEDSASSGSSQLPSPASSGLPPEPTMRSLFYGPMTQPHLNVPRRAAGNASRPDTRPSPFVADAPSSPTADWSSKRCAELTQRLEALQHTRSALSSQNVHSFQVRRPRLPAESDSVSGTSASEASRTEVAIRELEAEMAQLRGVLCTLNVRLADGHGGHLESLPEYVE